MLISIYGQAGCIGRLPSFFCEEHKGYSVTFNMYYVCTWDDS